jgi:hypothetical protein
MNNFRRLEGCRQKKRDLIRKIPHSRPCLSLSPPRSYPHSCPRHTLDPHSCRHRPPPTAAASLGPAVCCRRCSSPASSSRRIGPPPPPCHTTCRRIEPPTLAPFSNALPPTCTAARPPPVPVLLCPAGVSLRRCPPSLCPHRSSSAPTRRSLPPDRVCPTSVSSTPAASPPLLQGIAPPMSLQWTEIVGHFFDMNFV